MQMHTSEEKRNNYKNALGEKEQSENKNLFEIKNMQAETKVFRMSWEKKTIS
jgi:hypothetical protein